MFSITSGSLVFLLVNGNLRCKEERKCATDGNEAPRLCVHGKKMLGISSYSGKQALRLGVDRAGG